MLLWNIAGTVSGTRLLSAGMRQMAATATAAETLVSAAGEITTFPRPTTVVDYNIHWRSMFLKILMVQLYIFIGVVFYVYVLVEEKDGLPWSVVQAYYFSVVSISTVGYGDMSPSSVGSRIFTALYTLFGFSIVFTLAGTVVDQLLVAAQYITYAGLSRAMLGAQRIANGVRSHGKHGGLRTANYSASTKIAAAAETASSSPMAELEPAWRFYLRGAAFYLLLGLAISLLFSALILMEIEPEIDDYATALWHCWVTSTTVGYGDVGLTTDGARLFAACHIIFAVSWLSGVISMFGRLKFERENDLKYHNLISKQLSPTMIDDLNHGGTGDGVDQLEFVFGMLGLMGAELCNAPLNFKQHAIPLIQRFQQLDADGSNKLDSQDLKFMLDQAQKMHAARKEEAELEAAKKSSWMEGLKSKFMGTRSYPNRSPLSIRKRSTFLNLSRSSFRSRASATRVTEQAVPSGHAKVRKPQKSSLESVLQRAFTEAKFDV